MLYYNTLAVWLKTTRFQLLTRRYFPALVLGLLTLETLAVVRPVMGVRASASQQVTLLVLMQIQNVCVLCRKVDEFSMADVQSFLISLQQQQ